MRRSLEELVPRYQDALYRAAFSVCRNSADAEDAVQDTFVRYWRDSKEFESEEHLRAWLLRVTINRARDSLRSFWHQRRVNLDDYLDTLTFESPQDAELLSAVMALPEKCRIAIYLYYYEELPVREIGLILRARENTVKSWLHRGRALLRAQLGEEGWPDEEP